MATLDFGIDAIPDEWDNKPVSSDDLIPEIPVDLNIPGFELSFLIISLGAIVLYFRRKRRI